MGCGSSATSVTLTFVPTAAVPGQGSEAVRMFDKLQLKEQDVNRFFKLFRSIDVDRSDEIDLAEFYAFFKQDRTPFGDRAFAIMDDDGSGQISFQEFVCALWNYLSFDLASLVRFSFSLYDQDSSGYLDVEEARALVGDVYGSGFKANHRVQRILDVVDTNGDGRISFREFQDFNRRYPMILFPAFTMQQDLRRRVFGESYWKRVSKQRHKLGGDAGSLFDILNRMDAAKYKAHIDAMLASEATSGNGGWARPEAGLIARRSSKSKSTASSQRSVGTGGSGSDAGGGAVAGRGAGRKDRRTKSFRPTSELAADLDSVKGKRHGSSKSKRGVSGSSSVSGRRESGHAASKVPKRSATFGGGLTRRKSRKVAPLHATSYDAAGGGSFNEMTYGATGDYSAVVYGDTMLPQHGQGPLHGGQMSVDSASQLQGFDMSKFDMGAGDDGT